VGHRRLAAHRRLSSSEPLAKHDGINRALYVEVVQYAVEDRSQYEASCDDNQKTREDRVGARKYFSSCHLQLPHGPHTRQNHRRIDIRLCDRPGDDRADLRLPDNLGIAFQVEERKAASRKARRQVRVGTSAEHLVDRSRGVSLSW
jgi:hypothetical protein